MEKAGRMIISKSRTDNRDIGMLRNSEATLRSILQAAPLGIGLIHNRIINWSSHQMHEMLGYQTEDLIGIRERALYDSHEEYLRVGADNYAPARAPETKGTITRWRRKNGVIIDVHLQAAPINPDNLDAGMIFTALDISKRRQTEAALENLHRQMSRDQEELKNKSIALTEVFDHIDNQRDAVRTQVSDVVTNFLTPTLRKVKRPDGTINPYYYDLLAKGLRELAGATVDPLRQFTRLSPRELEISALVRQGRSSKQIADMLYISHGTVKRHRETIRKKLGLNNQDINLSIFLRNA